MAYISIATQRIQEIEADLAVFKFADSFYGVDSAVTQELPPLVQAQLAERLKGGAPVFIDSRGAIRAKRILYMPVGPLAKFDYAAITRFAERSLEEIAALLPWTRSIAMTIHGPGYGLDELRAFDSLFAGLNRGFSKASASDTWSVTIAESNAERAKLLDSRLRKRLELAALPTRANKPEPERSNHQTPAPMAHESPTPMPHVFVAMPFAKEFEDLFYYGIQKPIRDHGFDCVRMDHEYFVGDIMEQIKARITSSALVVADITGANANVYLEVGYAWGRSVPTLLLARESEKAKFDVQSHHSLLYGSVRELESKLHAALAALIRKQIILAPKP